MHSANTVVLSLMRWPHDEHRRAKAPGTPLWASKECEKLHGAPTSARLAMNRANIQARDSGSYATAHHSLALNSRIQSGSEPFESASLQYMDFALEQRSSENAVRAPHSGSMHQKTPNSRWQLAGPLNSVSRSTERDARVLANHRIVTALNTFSRPCFAHSSHPAGRSVLHAIRLLRANSRTDS